MPELDDYIHKNPSAAKFPWHADTLAKSGNIDEALSILKKGIDADPNNAAAHSVLGSVLLMKEDENGAIEALEKAISYDPQMPRDLLTVGRFYLKNEHPEKAMRYLWSAYQFDPNNDAVKSSYEEAVELKKAAEDLMLSDQSEMALSQLDGSATQIAPHPPAESEPVEEDQETQTLITGMAEIEAFTADDTDMEEPADDTSQKLEEPMAEAVSEDESAISSDEELMATEISSYEEDNVIETPSATEDVYTDDLESLLAEDTAPEESADIDEMPEQDTVETETSTELEEDVTDSGDIDLESIMAAETEAEEMPGAELDEIETDESALTDASELDENEAAIDEFESTAAEEESVTLDAAMPEMTEDVPEEPISEMDTEIEPDTLSGEMESESAVDATDLSDLGIEEDVSDEATSEDVSDTGIDTEITEEAVPTEPESDEKSKDFDLPDVSDEEFDALFDEESSDETGGSETPETGDIASQMTITPEPEVAEADDTATDIDDLTALYGGVSEEETDTGTAEDSDIPDTAPADTDTEENIAAEPEFDEDFEKEITSEILMVAGVEAVQERIEENEEVDETDFFEDGMAESGTDETAAGISLETPDDSAVADEDYSSEAATTAPGLASYDSALETVGSEDDTAAMPSFADLAGDMLEEDTTAEQSSEEEVVSESSIEDLIDEDSESEDGSDEFVSLIDEEAPILSEDEIEAATVEKELDLDSIIDVPQVDETVELTESSDEEFSSLIDETPGSDDSASVEIEDNAEDTLENETALSDESEEMDDMNLSSIEDDESATVPDMESAIDEDDESAIPDSDEGTSYLEEVSQIVEEDVRTSSAIELSTVGPGSGDQPSIVKPLDIDEEKDILGKSFDYDEVTEDEPVLTAEERAELMAMQEAPADTDMDDLIADTGIEIDSDSMANEKLPEEMSTEPHESDGVFGDLSHEEISILSEKADGKPDSEDELHLETREGIDYSDVLSDFSIETKDTDDSDSMEAIIREEEGLDSETMAVDLEEPGEASLDDLPESVAEAMPETESEQVRSGLENIGGIDIGTEETPEPPEEDIAETAFEMDSDESEMQADSPDYLSQLDSMDAAEDGDDETDVLSNILTEEDEEITDSDISGEVDTEEEVKLSETPENDYDEESVSIVETMLESAPEPDYDISDDEDLDIENYSEPDSEEDKPPVDESIERAVNLGRANAVETEVLTPSVEDDVYDLSGEDITPSEPVAETEKTAAPASDSSGESLEDLIMKYEMAFEPESPSAEKSEPSVEESAIETAEISVPPSQDKSPLNEANATMAEIFASQGLIEQAIQTYENILAGNPGKTEIASRIEELKQRLRDEMD